MNAVVGTENEEVVVVVQDHYDDWNSNSSQGEHYYTEKRRCDMTTTNTVPLSEFLMRIVMFHFYILLCR